MMRRPKHRGSFDIHDESGSEYGVAEPQPQQQAAPLSDFQRWIRNSPLALTPHPSPTSFLFASTATSPHVDETIHTLLAQFLPEFLDQLAQFQYKQAAEVLTCALSDGLAKKWANWDVFMLMARLAASCESTYVLGAYTLLITAWKAQSHVCFMAL